MRSIVFDAKDLLKSFVAEEERTDEYRRDREDDDADWVVESFAKVDASARDMDEQVRVRDCC